MYREVMRQHEARDRQEGRMATRRELEDDLTILDAKREVEDIYAQEQALDEEARWVTEWEESRRDEPTYDDLGDYDDWDDGPRHHENDYLDEQGGLDPYPEDMLGPIDDDYWFIPEPRLAWERLRLDDEPFPE